MRKSLKLDLWVKQIAHLHLGEYNYSPLFFTILASSLNYGTFFQNCVYSLFQATHANLCESMECYGAVAVDKTGNKNSLPSLFLTDGHSFS